MISSFDYYKKIENPNMYLCNPDRRPISALNAENRHLVLRFNDLSELTFTVPKIEGLEDSYALVESKRLIFIEKIGWFQIESAYETISGDHCSKEVTARSHQYMLKNRGFITEERVYMFYNPNDPLDERYDSNNKAAMPSVVGQLYQQAGIKVALTLSEIEQSEDKGDWTITFIDPILKFQAQSYGAMYEPREGVENICRSFEANENLNGYDFIINNVQNAFEIIFEFDFLYHTIKVKTLNAITQATDIYLSFDNIVNSLNVKENSEDVVTVMSCNGNDLDIRTVNPMGTNYIVDFDYYKKRISDDGKIEYPWMSKELIEALDEWKITFDSQQDGYGNLVASLQSKYAEKAIAEDRIRFANLKLTDMQVARDQYINKEDGTIDGSGIITAETVAVRENSIKEGTRFYNDIFSDMSILIGHIGKPDMTKEDSGIYTFKFADTGTSGTANDLIQNYVNEESGHDVEVPLYFIDEDNRSYCKLNIGTVIEVAKDEYGNPISFTYKPNDASVTGNIEIDNIVFSVSKSSIENSYVITCDDFSLKFTSNSYFVHNGIRYRVVASADGIVSLYRFYVSGFDRYTTYRETAGDGGWCSILENYINKTLVPSLREIDNQVKAIQDEMEAINDRCNVQKFIKRKGTELYDELSNYWVEGEYKNDNITTHDSTTMSERIELAKELMKAGEIDLKKCAQPQFEMSVDAINFIKMYEFRQFTNELVLGRTITIEKEDGFHYHPALMSIEYDLDLSDSFTMNFSNASKLGETSMTFADLIKESSSTSRTVSANWSNLTDYSRNKEQITRLIEAPLDRSLRAMQASLASQAFVIDESGILGRKYDQPFDGANGTFSPEQIRIINNTIVFTKDNWETAALALGKTDYGYGLVADVLVGELILGEKISIGSNSERVRIDDSGLLIKNDNGNAVFEADTNGNVTFTGTVFAKDGEFTGIIKAKKGEIGGYVIDTESLVGNGVGMCSAKSGDNVISFWAGSNTPNDAPFYVTNSGSLIAKNGNIGGLILSENSLGSGNGAFSLTSDGRLSAMNADIQGEIHAYGNDNTIANLASNRIYTENLEVQNFTFGDNEIRHSSGTAINLGYYTGAQEDNRATLTAEYEPRPGWAYNTILTINFAKPLSFMMKFLIKYYVPSASEAIKYVTKELTVPGGVSTYSFTFDWRMNNPTFASTDSDTYNFTQQSVTAQTSAIGITGSIIPTQNNLYLGSSDKRWAYIYGDIIRGMDIKSDSDRRKKTGIEPLDRTLCHALIERLKPCTYIFKSDLNKKHRSGLIAQDVEDSIYEIGNNAFESIVSNIDGSYHLGYTELIAPIISVLQDCVKEIDNIKHELINSKVSK